MLNSKGMRFPIDVILVCIRWFVAYPLSYRHLEEMMEERCVEVDHSSINRWAIRFLLLLEKVFRQHKHPVGSSWRVDETYILVKGVWKYLYRAVDKAGKTIDFLLTAKRDKNAATRFFEKAMQTYGTPKKSQWAKAASTNRQSIRLFKTRILRLKFARTNTSTISSSKITGLSNETPRPCSASSHFMQPPTCWQGSS